MSDTNRQLIDEYGNIHQISKELARGGQGIVYRTQDADLAIKQPLDADGKPDYTANISSTFHHIRTLPIPERLHLSMPLAILRDEPGYVMRLLKDMKSFADFSLDGASRTSMGVKNLPQWVSGLSNKNFAQDLTDYAQTGSTRRRLYALYKCAAILARLHNAGIVYGDVSANNVFIGKTIPCDCWMIDADNLRLELRHGGHTVYTPHLGAPEIVQGKDSGRPRTDCWAFAVMAFQLLALCHPFIGKKVLEPEEDSGWDTEEDADTPAQDMDAQADLGLLPYIDDEDDDSNALPRQYENLPRQLVLTPQLQRLFQETFGVGREHPHRRPSMAFWALELARAFDNSIICPSCHMSYFYASETETEKCPYCQTSRPALAIARTERWQKLLLGNPKEELPQRLFHAFSFANGDMSEYEAEINFKNKTISPVRGTKPFPSNLSFDFIPAYDKQENAK